MQRMQPNFPGKTVLRLPALESGVILGTVPINLSSVSANVRDQVRALTAYLEDRRYRKDTVSEPGGNAR